MRGVFDLSILNHRARGCRAALLPAWMQAPACGRLQRKKPAAEYRGSQSFA